MDGYSVGPRYDRTQERLARASALAASRGDRVSIHSLRDRLHAEQNRQNILDYYYNTGGWQRDPTDRS
jgi:hypothetical protein